MSTASTAGPAEGWPAGSTRISLLYHDVFDLSAEETGFRGAASDRYKLARADFEAHLDAIAEAQPLAATSALIPAPAKSFHMTFDDGGSSSLAIADLLERRGGIGHFFIPTDFVGTQGFVDAAAIRDLAKRGHVIGSHSCSHPLTMANLAEADLRREWRDSVAVLSDILGTAVTCGAIPAGNYARRVAEAAERAGLALLYTSEPTVTPWRIGDLTLLGRFSIMGNTRPEMVAALARGDRRTVAGQRLAWGAKRAVRRVTGPLWLQVRDVMLRSRDAR